MPKNLYFILNEIELAIKKNMIRDDDTIFNHIALLVFFIIQFYLSHNLDRLVLTYSVDV